MAEAGAQAPAAADVARSCFDAIAARDPDAIASRWHPEGVEDAVPLRVFRGPEEVRALFAELFDAATRVRDWLCTG